MKRLYRSRDDKLIGGICGGIGKTWNVDPNIIRIVTVFAAVITGILPVLVAYLIAWVILPLSPEELSVTHATYEREETAEGAEPPLRATPREDGPAHGPPAGA